MVTDVLRQVFVISLAIQGFVEAAIKPIFVKFKLDTWWLFYVAGAIGLLVGWFGGFNAFTGWFEHTPWLGRVFTTAAMFAGPSFLYNMVDNGQAARLPMAIK